MYEPDSVCIQNAQTKGRSRYPTSYWGYMDLKLKKKKRVLTPNELKGDYIQIIEL